LQRELVTEPRPEFGFAQNENMGIPLVVTFCPSRHLAAMQRFAQFSEKFEDHYFGEQRAERRMPRCKKDTGQGL